MISQSLWVETSDIFKTSYLFLLPPLERNTVKSNMVKLKAVFRRRGRVLYSFPCVSEPWECPRIHSQGHPFLWTHKAAIGSLFSAPWLITFPPQNPGPHSPQEVLWWLIVWYPEETSLFLNTSLRVFLGEFSIWIGGGRKQTTLPNVGGHHPIYWGPEQNAKVAEGQNCPSLPDSLSWKFGLWPLD